MHRVFLVSLLLILCVALSVPAQTTLPIVEEVEWEPLRNHCRQLMKMIDKGDGKGGVTPPLPAETVRALQQLLAKKADDPNAAVRAVQKLLDPHCLLAVSINPESRVKAMRGPAIAKLRQNEETIVLLKIHNDGGVTHQLRLRGPEITRAGERGEDRWLRAVLVVDAPFGAKLSGRRLEYRLLRLTPREAGKREATFQFDVGQGTQDLGFRAEVPVLFSIREAKRD
ncbi:MAG TPA: hypothetical protein VN688_25840 [Gemmataceae bacterium]|nr:hypothetical protein [Gemmataceae bacterium]